MTINYETETDIPFDFDACSLAHSVIEFAMDYEHFPYEYEVNLTLVDNERIHEINHEFRQIDRATDVLSFPLIDYLSPVDYSQLESSDDYFNPDTGEAMLGDIVISVPKVLEQADAYQHSIKREYSFLIVHSILHLLGYDHMTPEEAAVMEKKQHDILEQMNITR